MQAQPGLCLLLACVLVGMSGCSWVFMTSPPPEDEWDGLVFEQASCSTGVGPAVTDTVVAATMVLGGAASEDPAALLVGSVWATSATMGYLWSSDCDAYEEHMTAARQKEQQRVQAELDAMREQLIAANETFLRVTLVDATTGAPVGGAIIAYPDGDFTRQASDEETGEFRSYGVRPGELRFIVTHPESMVRTVLR